MTTVYKLTDKDGYTRRGESNETLWEVGKTVRPTGTGGLCSAGVIHAYRTPLLAMLYNPIYGHFYPWRMWVGQGTVTADDGTKLGLSDLTLASELTDLNPPDLTTHQRVAAAVLMAWSHDTPVEWQQWAIGWINGAAARAASAATAAARAAWATWAAESAAESAAAWAAESAAEGAEAVALRQDAILQLAIREF